MPRYIVKNENTLGYLISSTCMGVLASNKDGHAWINGPCAIGQLDSIRTATSNDFNQFRVMEPTDAKG